MKSTISNPTAIDAERALLGSVLLDPNVLAEVSQNIAASDFFITRHQWIWNAMLKLAETETQIDNRTLCWQLEQAGRLEEIGGAAYITQLIHSCTTSINASSYAEIIRDASYRRHIIETASQIATEAHNGASPDKLQAIANCITDIPSNRPRMVWTAYQLCNSDLGEANWLVNGMLLSGGVNLLAGEPAAGKSFLSLDLALGIAQTGFAWNNIAVPRGKVLYHYLDGSPRGMKSRIQNLCNAKKVPPPNDLYIDCSPLDLRKSVDTATLKQRIKKMDFSLVIFDVLARFMPGGDENSVSDISPIMGTLRDLATSTDTTILIIHHLNKNAGSALWSRIRGSSDILAAVDTALIVTYGQNRKNAPRRVVPEKNREGELQQPFLFKIETSNECLSLSFDHDDDNEPKQDTTKFSTTLQQFEIILEDHPDAVFTRQELIDSLPDGIEISDRSLARVFSALRKNHSIQTGQLGSQTTYQWVTN